MRHRINRLHFVGIGGTGMCGIAEVMHNLGYQISGSDMHEGASLNRLRGIGIKVFVGHDASQVKNADVVVVSSAIPDDNVELIHARKTGLPVVPRATMLNELLRLRQGIAVAGSHGKTTITSMIASLLQEGGLDPTYVVGGLVRRFGNNAALGKGEFIVVETDESDGSFLHLFPVISVAANIDSDHLESYGQDLRRLKRAFVDFFENLPFYGVAVICCDDPQLRDVRGLISRRVISYGIEDVEVDFHAHDIRIRSEYTTYRLEAPYGSQEVKLNAIGLHNVTNSLAALAVAHEVNIAPEVAAQALANFRGVGRRLENHGRIELGGCQVLLVDDYGHHPTEIDATLAALRSAYPRNRIVLVFQPHRYSRTRDHFDTLVKVLVNADVLVLTDVYGAGEDPIIGVDSEALCKALCQRATGKIFHVPDLEEIPTKLVDLVVDDDIVLIMGAGSIAMVASNLAQKVNL